jgi:hypothetical protein
VTRSTRAAGNPPRRACSRHFESKDALGRGVPVRAANRDCDLTRHGTSSSLPVVLRLSMSACALAASASGYSPPIRTLSFPSVIQSNRCAKRARHHLEH